MAGMLPNTLVLTYPKTGSTSLHAAFVAHPEIGMPNAKETFFFSDFFEKGVEWYAYRFEHCKNRTVRCDFASTLMYNQGFSDKLKKIIPDAKFLVLLRDPVKRCFSHYLHEYRRGLLQGTFEEELFRKRFSVMPKSEKCEYSLFDVGKLYIDNADEILTSFKREQIHFILLEELVENSVVFENVFRFLGVSHYSTKLPKINKARVPKNGLGPRALKRATGLLQRSHRNNVLQRFVPSVLKVSTRNLRWYFKTSVDQLVEKHSYALIENPTPPQHIIDSIEDYYNDTLSGLDKMLSIDLHKFWPWYRH